MTDEIIHKNGSRGQKVSTITQGKSDHDHCPCESIEIEATVHGVGLDAQTRCAHWHSPLDVVAIRMRCCGRYYACRECHDGLESHAAEVWPRDEWDQRAILCGVCRGELTITEYVEGPSRCPACGAGFNPGCKDHHGRYFES